MGKLAESLNRLPAGSRLYRLQTRSQLLAKSSQTERLFELLTDFDFIEAKVSHPDIKLQELIEDYDRAFEPKVLIAGEKAETLRLIQGALRLSAHILEQDKTQLVGQLWGRLMSFEVLEIRAILEAAEQSKDTPWLRPLTPSLSPPGGRLLRTLAGHSDFVNALAVTPDGKLAISGSSDKTLKVWNLPTGKELLTLTGHSNWVSAVVVTPDGKQVISGSGDKTLKVWNLPTGEEVFTLTGHSKTVSAVAVSPDGKVVISGSWDKTVKVWNLLTAEELFTLTGHSASVYALGVTSDGKMAISGSGDKTLKVWNLSTGEELFTLNGLTDFANPLAVTNDGKLVIPDYGGKTLKVWDLAGQGEAFG